MDASRRSSQKDVSRNDAKQAWISSTKKPFTSEDDFEHVEQPQPRLHELLTLLTTKLPDLARQPQTEVNDTFWTDLDTNENKSLRSEHEDLKKQNKELDRHIKETETKCQDEVYKLQQTIDMQRKEIETLKNDQRDQQKLKDNRSINAQYGEEIKRKLQSYDSMSLKLKETENKLQLTTTELDETKTRLSKSMGDKLKDNNANIANLSDKDRPTKLAERFQELYDNDWTDAFEIMNKIYRSEERRFAVLFNILMDTMAFCEKEANQQTNEMEKTVTQSVSTGSEIPSEVNKLVKEFRRNVAVFSGKQVYKKYQTELILLKTSTADSARLIPRFVWECFQICWLMTVQDPPLAFGPAVYKGESFNSEMFKAYTQSGSKVAYVVWPALSLHTRGPVLCKGIAQGCGEGQRTRSATQNSRYQEKLGTETRKDDTEEIDESKDVNCKGTYISREIKLTGLVYGVASPSYKQTTTKMSTPYTVEEKAPSDHDVETFLKLRETYGAEGTRNMMNYKRYESIRRFCKRGGIIKFILMRTYMIFEKIS